MSEGDPGRKEMAVRRKSFDLFQEEGGQWVLEVLISTQSTARWLQDSFTADSCQLNGLTVDARGVVSDERVVMTPGEHGIFKRRDYGSRDIVVRLGDGNPSSVEVVRDHNDRYGDYMRAPREDDRKKGSGVVIEKLPVYKPKFFMAEGDVTVRSCSLFDWLDSGHHPVRGYRVVIAADTIRPINSR